MPKPASPSFLGMPQTAIDELQEGDLAILGIPEATPYSPGKSSHAAGAPAAIRQALAKFSGWTGHFDFDTGGSLLPEGCRIADLGNLEGDPAQPQDNRERITSAVKQILNARALPIVIGGDDSVPIPLLHAYKAEAPFWLVQIDAHLDWRDEREGERLGWSSTMRRASEMGWIEGIVQAGLRGPGSARAADVRYARDYGARLFTAREIDANGIGAVAEAVPQGARCFITLDCDGLDPAVVPAVLSAAPGGLSYWQVVALTEALAGRTEIVGFDLVELAPDRDVNGLGALTAGRIVCNLCAALAQGHSRGS